MKWGKKKQAVQEQADRSGQEGIPADRNRPEWTREDLVRKLEALGEITTPERNRITCALIGHSRIVTYCFGYVSCARCGDQIGDTLGGMASLEHSVVVGHACDICRANYEKLSWQDKLFVANPFEGQEGAKE